MKKPILIAVVGLILFLIFNYAYTQERITLSTYYPAPYGEYRKLAIGSSTGGYTAPASPDIDLVVEGGVGIGTTSPGAKLDIYESSASTDALLYLDTVDYHSRIRLGHVSANEYGEIHYDRSGNTLLNIRSVYTNGGIAFSTGGTSEKVRIDKNGNVGIGTTDPGTNKLEVVGGPIKATGGLVIETRTSDPASPATGQMWLRTDL